MSQAGAIPTRNPSRRQALTGALAVPFVFVAPAAPAADPILDLIARHVALIDACPADFEEETEARWLAEVSAFEEQFFDARPATRAGAFAAARHAVKEMRDFAGVGWALALLDNALGFLEAEGRA
jgi:hypothetical protein